MRGSHRRRRGQRPARAGRAELDAAGPAEADMATSGSTRPPLVKRAAGLNGTVGVALTGRRGGASLDFHGTKLA